MKTEPFVGETYIADGWQYRDMPKTTQECFNEFLDIVGEKNIRFMTFARYPDKTVRGQCLISPDGLDNLKNWKAKNAKSN